MKIKNGETGLMNKRSLVKRNRKQIFEKKVLALSFSVSLLFRNFYRNHRKMWNQKNGNKKKSK